MLKKGIKFLFLFFFVSSCNEKKENVTRFYETSVRQVGYENYRSVLLKLSDSITHWKLNKVGLFNIDTSMGCNFLDTLLCFNSEGDRFITCILYVSKNKTNPTGVLNYLFGEKQNESWYFFAANTSIFIPNSLKTNRKTLFFDYDELHAEALKNVYNGYLLSDGKINDPWFNSQFENIGWGNFNDQTINLERMGQTERYTSSRKFFEAIHLQSVKNNWANRDTTNPIIPFPSKSLQ